MKLNGEGSAILLQQIYKSESIIFFKLTGSGSKLEDCWNFNWKIGYGQDVHGRVF